MTNIAALKELQASISYDSIAGLKADPVYDTITGIKDNVPTDTTTNWRHLYMYNPSLYLLTKNLIIVTAMAELV